MFLWTENKLSVNKRDMHIFIVHIPWRANNYFQVFPFIAYLIAV